MDNCDLERLSFSGWKLQPAFRADVTNYKVTVASHVNKVTLDLRTSDCGASYRILFGDGSKTLRLNDGVNEAEIEVVAEDGTTKKYRVELTKLSATAAELSELTIDGNVPLYPEFDTRIYEYNSTVPFYCNSVTMLPKLPDKDMKVFVNEDDSTKPVLLNVGDTVVVIRVSSADGSNIQVYTVFVTREPIPMAVTFSDGRDQVAFECPVSLTALYRPISIHPSYPKHVFSGPYIEMLVRRSKVDPLNECPLGDGWKVLEAELDKKMSAGLVKCFFAYRGCDHVMKLSEVGSHALDCPRRPRGELDIKDVADTDWYKQHFTTSASTLVIETLHTLEVRNWERRLQKAVRQGIVDDLCILAQDQLKLYRQRLPKPGDLLHYEDGENPLEILEQAAVYFASAIRLKSREARLHFLLGLTLEEHHYAMGMYGLKKAEWEDEEHSEAKVVACQEEILAVCKLHGFRGTPTLENQLQALDKEYRQLKDDGLSAKADQVQTLYIWLSKKAGKDGSAAVKDPENCVQHALMKYLDAWTLSPDNWEYNLHVGRLLLLQGQSKEALQHLQTGLALRPVHPGLRFYTGLALLQQEARASEATEKQAALFLQQGLEHLLSKHCRPSDMEWDPSDPISSLNSQFLRGVLSLGELQQRRVLKVKSLTAEQVYHTVAVLTAQAVSQCVCRGEVTRQLEWVLLEAHFALLQRLIHHRMPSQDSAGTDRQVYVAKRSQALMALTRLTSIAPCQELLDMQEKVCQVAVVTVPRDAHALCILGLAQLDQCDNEPDSIRSKIALANACLSFRASIELEGQCQSGEPPAQLHEQKWWQERLDVDRRKAAKQTPSQLAGGKGPSDTAAAGKGSGRGKGGPGRWGAAAAKAPTTTTSTSTMKGGKAAPPAAKPPAARGRGGAAVKANGAAKPGAAVKANGAAKPPSKPGSKTTLSRSKSRPDCDSSSAERTEEPATVNRDHSLPNAVNRRSHMARLGLARALSRSARSLDKAKKLYCEVISMAPRVHDSYIELAQLLEPSDALAAVGVYCKYPLKPAADQSMDDAFITGEIVRLLVKLEMFDHHQLGPCLIAHAKVMGAVCIEKYIDILDAKFMTRLLKTVYAGLHDKSEDDKDLQDFFKFKGWI